MSLWGNIMKTTCCSLYVAHAAPSRSECTCNQRRVHEVYCGRIDNKIKMLSLIRLANKT